MRNEMKKILYKDLIRVSNGKISTICSEDEFIKNTDYFLNLLSSDNRKVIEEKMLYSPSIEKKYENSLKSLENIMMESV